MINFDIAFERLINHEGNYVNNPADPGGETKFGISKRSYPNVDIKNLTREQAKEIYHKDFWYVIGDTIDSAILFQVFDFAVNAGIQTAIRKLQDAVNVADDGHWGPASIKAAMNMDKNDILMRFSARKIRYYTKLTTFYPQFNPEKDGFGKGWMNRVADDLDLAAEDN
jgi:lysozyme family protein